MNPRIAFALAFGFAGLTADVAVADDSTPVAERPWFADQALATKAVNAVQGGGIRALEPFVPDIEKALANAQDSIAGAASGSGGTIVLTDGASDTLMALITASSGNKPTQAIPNPYPVLGLYLGSYYNEVGKSDQAVRVLDEALAATSDVGAHRPILISERGAALEALQRWADALADYNDGLKIKGLDPATHALLLRGRGFSLTELGQLDDAEAAYRESLTFEPGNQRAQSELDYIDKLRMGGDKAPSGLFTVQHPAAQPAGNTPDPPQAPSGQ